jgi:hypothetical protein
MAAQRRFTIFRLRRYHNREKLKNISAAMSKTSPPLRHQGDPGHRGHHN